MGADEIARLTGLGPDAAARAADRAFSEPGLWTGTGNGRAAFMSTLADRGIAARQGGRFLTLSFGATKADRMAEIAHRYGDPPTVALGDAPNDAEMLEAADRGIVVANPHGAPLPPLAGEAEGRITRTDLPGPAGWNEAMLGVLNGMGL